MVPDLWPRAPSTSSRSSARASIVVGVFPAIDAGAVVLFLVVSAVTMHDFWNAEGEDAQTEMPQFLKNASLSAGALAFLALSGVGWQFALNVGL